MSIQQQAQNWIVEHEGAVVAVAFRDVDEFVAVGGDGLDTCGKTLGEALAGALERSGIPSHCWPPEAQAVWQAWQAKHASIDYALPF